MGAVAVGLVVSVVGAIASNLLGALFAPISKQEGPRLDDLTVPKSEYGKSIPKIYGISKATGNLMWGRPIKERTVRLSSGTFKASVEQTKYYYYGTAAWLLSEGNVTLKKVWANGKLLWNSDASTGQTAAGGRNWSRYFTFYGGEQETPDSIIESYEGVGRVPVFKGKAYILFDNLPLEIFGNRLPEIVCELQSTINPPLKDVVIDICKRAGIAEEDTDVSQLSGNINGLICPNNGETYRDLLEELGQIYFFYAYQEGSKIRFRHYQRPGTITSIPVEDLATRDDGAERPDNYLQKKRFGSELPSNISLTFQNRFANLEQDVQNAFRSTNLSSLQRIHQNDTNVTTKCSLSRTEAFIFAHRILHQIWATRVTYENILLPPKWINAISVGEVVSLPTGNDPYNLIPIQITDLEIGANLMISCKAQLYDGNIPAQSIDVNIDETTNTEDSVFSSNWNGGGVVQFLDIQGIKTPNVVAYLGVYSKTPEYTTAEILTGDDEVNLASLTSVNDQITHGECLSILGSSRTDVLDKNNTLLVYLNKTISSLSGFDFLNLNTILLVGSELICFQNAVLTGENTYLLSHFIRGLFNTEKYTNTHAAAEKVYLIDSNFTTVSDLLANQLKYYAALSAYDDIDFVAKIPFIWTAKSAECYSIVHLKSYNYPEQLVFKWTRRTRGYTNWNMNADAPLHEAFERYFVEYSVTSLNFVRSFYSLESSCIYTLENAFSDGLLNINDVALLDDDNVTVFDDNNETIISSNHSFSLAFNCAVAQVSDSRGYSDTTSTLVTWKGDY